MAVRLVVKVDTEIQRAIYEREKLQEWIDQRILPMASQAMTGIIMFNNHVRGQAPANARTLIRLLNEAGLTVSGPTGTP